MRRRCQESQMNYYQKLSQPAVRAEIAEDWPLAASQWQTLLRRPAAHPWRLWIRGRVLYCRAGACAMPLRHGGR